MKRSVRGQGRTAWLVAVMLSFTLAACATSTGRVRNQSDLLPRPGAAVRLGTVADASDAHLGVDAVALLRTAMHAALQRERLSARTRSGGFVLNLEIAEYRPGNAFKRWLLPGYGSTVLSVRGTLVDPTTGAVAVTVEQRRAIYMGGAFTIGAWKSVFGAVADDLARDLKTRIEKGGDFVVYLSPRADQPAVAQPGTRGATVQVLDIRDARANKGSIGSRKAAFGVSMGEIHLGRRVTEVIREALVDDLQIAGHPVVGSGADLTVSGRILKFHVRTDTTALYWDVVGDIEIELTVRRTGTPAAPVRNSFACHQVERTYVWPGAKLVGRVLDTCLNRLMVQVRGDPIWNATAP